MKTYVSHYDLRLFRAIFNFHRESFLPVFFRIISFIGDGYFYFTYLIYIYFAEQGTFRYAIYVSLIGFAIELPIYRLLKNTIRRVRPFNTHEDIKNMVYPLDEFSFPSGHTSAAFLVAMIMAHFTPFLAVPIFIFAFMVGLSRIYLGVHYPSDILAGAVFGSAVGALAIFLVEHVIF